MGEKGRNQKHKNPNEAKEGDEERKDKRKSLCFLQAFLPSFLSSLLFSSLRCFAFWKNFLQTQEGKKNKTKQPQQQQRLSYSSPRLSRKLVGKKKTEKQQRQQTNALHQKTCRAPDSDTTDKEKGRKSGRSERPVLRPNAIITRRFGGPLRAWVAGSIITRSWDSIITLTGFRRIILA